MSLKIIRLETTRARSTLIAGAFLCLAAAFFFAKWSFANAVSMRADSKEVADLAVQLAPSDPQTHYAAAVVYDKTFDAADFARSLDEHELSVALSPNNYLLWLDLGKARERNGDSTGAENALRKALELAPNYAAVQWAYGNTLLRAGQMDEGFSQIRLAAAAKREYMNAAVVTAMMLLDGDAAKAQNVLGSTPAVKAAFAAFQMHGEHYDEAAAAWDAIPSDVKRTEFREAGEALSAQLAAAKKFRLASHVAREIWDGEGPAVGRIFNGGFETAIKQMDARLFDWQIGGGVEPQIGLSEEQKHGGGYSLFMKFNTMQASDFRQFSQTVAVEPGRPYSLEGFYRVELKGAVAWEIADANDGKSLSRSAPTQSSADWTYFRVNFDVPANSDGVIIRLVRDGCTSSICPISGKAWFDDLSLTGLADLVNRQ